MNPQSVQPVRGINSPSESKNPLKRIDENIQRISHRFQPISAISPEIDFRVGGDVQAVQPVWGLLFLTTERIMSLPTIYLKVPRMLYKKCVK
ncbi:hypothetical protein IM676_03825 [Anabaenopsis elenkinii CCIBt3563]|uniref:Uncharacterized protein n=1 Tax=Anabaenopsis elenkinii CCIBt3563 TaxID=2779889 RepID=A0A7S6REN1_9CYAN|nr:hypothetical protein IM676_03825 [Anabaenopsis elenkinii CCIBt3563]